MEKIIQKIKIVNGENSVPILKSTFTSTDGSRLIQNIEQPFEEVTEDFITKFRQSNKAGIIVKKQGKNFFKEISKNVKLPDSENILHICGSCKHLSVLPDELGGCGKARNSNADEIETFPFIIDGLEYINIDRPSAVGMWVYQCQNFIPD